MAPTQRLLSGTVVALLVVVFNVMLWTNFDSQRSMARSTAICLLLLGQTAAFAWAAQYWINRPALRGLIFTWCVLLFDLWIFAYFRWRNELYSHPPLNHALLTGQTVAIALAIGLTVRSPTLAHLCAFAALIATGRCSLWVLRVPGWDDATCKLLLIGQGAAICAVIAFLRARGYYFGTPWSAHEPESHTPHRLRPRFSLRQLFVGLAAIALALASLRVLKRTWHPYQLFHDGAQAAMLSVDFAVIVWGTACVASGRRRVLMSLTALLIVEFSLGFAGQALFAVWHQRYFPQDTYASVLSSEYILRWAPWPALVSASLAAVLLMMHVAGYCLQRSPTQVINTVQTRGERTRNESQGRA